MSGTSSDLPGRVGISPRALSRTVAAVAAEELRVPVKDVSVTLTDDAGNLAVAVVAPLRVEPLRLADVAGREPSVVATTQAARGVIRERVTSVTGSTVSRVNVRVSRAVILEEKRVR